jgi:hypothetical protein
MRDRSSGHGRSGLGGHPAVPEVNQLMPSSSLRNLGRWFLNIARVELRRQLGILAVGAFLFVLLTVVSLQLFGTSSGSIHADFVSGSVGLLSGVITFFAATDVLLLLVSRKLRGFLRDVPMAHIPEEQDVHAARELLHALDRRLKLWWGSIPFALALVAGAEMWGGDVYWRRVASCHFVGWIGLGPIFAWSVVREAVEVKYAMLRVRSTVGDRVPGGATDACG